MGCEGTHPLGDNSGEGTSTRVMSDVELALREEVLRLSKLVREKRGLQKGLRLSEAVIDAPADTSERDRDLAASEAARMRLEGDLQTLRAEMDRLKAEACSERLVRDALEAQVNDLRAKLVSYEASTQSGAIVAFVPSRLSSGEERALIHDQYTERMDRMALCHEEVVADLRRRLDRYCQRGRKREVMRFRTRCELFLSVLLVRLHLLHRLVIMEQLHRVIVLWLIS